MLLTIMMVALSTTNVCDYVYTIKPNDTLTEISQKCGGDASVESLYIFNSNIKDPNVIFPKQRIKIPCKPLGDVLNEAIYVSTSNISDEHLRSYTIKEINKKTRINRFKLILSQYINKPKISKPKVSESPDATIQISGLIYDETVTKSGYDFYTLFYNKWESPKDTKNYSITITEYPAPGMGTFVEVKLNYETVYKNRIKPSFDEIDEVSSEAIQYTKHYIENFQYSVEIY